MYADDHQFYAMGRTTVNVLEGLVASASFRWCNNNFLKATFNKYQTMTPENKNTHMNIVNIDNHEVEPTNCLKLLVVLIDKNLGAWV